MGIGKGVNESEQPRFANFLISNHISYFLYMLSHFHYYTVFVFPDMLEKSKCGLQESLARNARYFVIHI